MFQVGDKVVYGTHGVCIVKGEEVQKFDKKPVTYLVLEPLGQENAKYMVPMNNAVSMSRVCPILSREELEALLASEEIRQDSWIPDEKLRKQMYRDLIGSGDRTRILQMVYSLYRHKTSQTSAGKKVHLCDENFLRDAERLLAGEMAIVLDLPVDQTRQYLRTHLRAE